MTQTRVLAGILSLVLLALLGWCLVRGVGDVRTQIMLGVGSFLGILYTVFGRLPEWLIEHSGGSLAADDDPRNIPPLLYLSAIGAVILIAVIIFFVVVYVL